MKSKSSDYFDWIEILRGVAALGVVLFHSRVDLWVGWQEIQLHPENFSHFDKAIAWLSIPTPFFGSLVMLFFLLSGFCIHYPSALSERIDVKKYFIRRLIRILPPYYAAVLISLIVEWIIVVIFHQNASTPLTVGKTLLMIQNYPPYPSQLFSNPSLWSLPVEVELYVVYPLIFWFSHLVGGKMTLFTVAIVSFISLCFTLSIAPWLDGDFLKYWIIWCSGATLAQVIRTQGLPMWKLSHGIATICIFFIAFITGLNNVPSSITHFIWATAYFFLLWFCLSLPSPSLFLSKHTHKCLAWLGKISYSLYLTHFPFFKLLGVVWVSIVDSKPSNFLICLIASLISIFVGGIFYYIAEKPAHLLARKFGSKNGINENTTISSYR